MSDSYPRSGSARLLPLDAITIDPSLQPREELSPATREEYADLYRDGESGPRPVVFAAGGEHLLVAGFHRVPAARDAGIRHLECWVVPGTRGDAVLYAAGTNRRHGLPRTPG